MEYKITVNQFGPTFIQSGGLMYEPQQKDSTMNAIVNFNESGLQTYTLTHARAHIRAHAYKQFWHTVAVEAALHLAPCLTAAFGAVMGKAELENPYCHGNWDTDSYEMLLWQNNYWTIRDGNPATPPQAYTHANMATVTQPMTSDEAANTYIRLNNLLWTQGLSPYWRTWYSSDQWDCVYHSLKESEIISHSTYQADVLGLAGQK